MSLTGFQSTYTILIGTATISRDNFDCDIKVIMNSSKEPDILTVKIYNITAVLQTFIQTGLPITIIMGYSNGVVGNIITGIVTRVYSDIIRGEEVLVIEGIDKTIHDLKRTVINLSINVPTEISAIAAQVASSAGVGIFATPTGVTIDNYTAENQRAFDVIVDLANRIGYNVTAKNSILYFSPQLSIGTTIAVITDEFGFRFSKVSGSTYDSENSGTGFNFEGSGIPTLLPLRLVNLSILNEDQGIIGTYMIETIEHSYDSEFGYMCRGNIIEPAAALPEVKTVQMPTVKSIASEIYSLIEAFFTRKSTLETGIIDSVETALRLVTCGIGIDPAKNKGSVVPSIEAIIEKYAFLNRKPLVSPFAGDGYGLVVPVYAGMRPVIGHNKYSKQDANIMGFLWKSGWTIPDHDEGDYMLHHLNHSKEVHKEDGSKVVQVKSLKIQVGNNGLTVTKPTKGTDDTLLIEFDDGSKLEFDGSKWVVNTTGSVEIGSSASSVKLAGGGHKLAHATHTHNMSVHIHTVAGVMPGMVTLPTTQANPADTQAPTDNTVITEAD